MWLIDQLAERRIAEATQRGEFEQLPGTGRRLELEADALVPEELRVAYRLLKNAGFLPPEVAIRTEIKQVEDLLARVEDEEVSRNGRKRIRALLAKLRAHGGRERGAMITEAAYFQQIAESLSKGRPQHDGNRSAGYAGLGHKKIASEDPT